LTRRAYRLVVTAFAILAVAVIVAFAVIFHEVNRNANTQARVRSTGIALGAVVIKVTGAVCELVIQPSNARKRQLVEEYAAGKPIVLSKLDPLCKTTVGRAIHDVFDHNVPREITALLQKGDEP
jgi:hypothetical protein